MRGLLFAVVDFQVPAELSAQRADLGGKIADAFASSLREQTSSQVIRTAVVLTTADLANPARTLPLKRELGADVLVGGKLGDSGKDLTIESVRALDGQLLATTKSDIDAKSPSQIVEFWVARSLRQTDLTAFVMEFKSPAYLLAHDSDQEVPITRTFQDLDAGDRVRCGRGGELAIEINGVLFRIEPSEKWFAVDATSASATAEQLLGEMSEKIITESKSKFHVVASR